MRTFHSPKNTCCHPLPWHRGRHTGRILWIVIFSLHLSLSLCLCLSLHAVSVFYLFCLFVCLFVCFFVLMVSFNLFVSRSSMSYLLLLYDHYCYYLFVLFFSQWHLMSTGLQEDPPYLPLWRHCLFVCFFDIWNKDCAGVGGKKWQPQHVCRQNLNGKRRYSVVNSPHFPFS